MLNKKFEKSTAKKVPSSRLSRISHFGGLAAKIAGNVLVNSAKELSKGNRPNTKSLLLSTSNVEQLANKLSELRGAAMKLGQMISMDAGELMPPELSALLAKLRSNASPMLHKQLVAILKQHWGDTWVDNFSSFDLRPFAAASIGQVHQAHLAKGQKLAIKVQYPGVKESIASDIDNVAAVLKLSGLLPKHISIDDLLEEAKQQLQDEADYRLEAQYIKNYQSHINSEHFQLPEVISELSSEAVLVMHFVEGIELEETITLPQTERNYIVQILIQLFLQELFDFKLMQTDPNLANFVYQPTTQKVGLLDFGATRVSPPHISQGYKALIKADLSGNKEQMVDAARTIGFFNEEINEDYLADVLQIFELACQPLKFEGEYDFGSSKIATQIKDKGLALNRKKSEWHTPPIDALFIHRKLAGLYLIAAKLNARVDVKKLLEPYL